MSISRSEDGTVVTHQLTRVCSLIICVDVDTDIDTDTDVDTQKRGRVRLARRLAEAGVDRQVGGASAVAHEGPRDAGRLGADGGAHGVRAGVGNDCHFVLRR